MAGAFFSIFNDDTFYPATGLQNPAPVLEPGPFFGLEATVLSILPSTFSVDALPIISINQSQGLI